MVLATLEEVILWLHIAAGFVALFAGAVALITEKGGDRHRLAGRFYVRSMALVISTVPILVAFDPSDRFLQFLLVVALFSGYLVFGGYRVLSHKHPTAKGDAVDWVTGGFVALASLGFGGWGVALATGGSAIGIGMIVFAVGGITVSGSQLRDFRTPDRRDPWMADHLSLMIGGYIATVTAVSVVNFNVVFPGIVPEVVAWVWPAAVMGPLIFYWQGKYTDIGPLADVVD